MKILYQYRVVVPATLIRSKSCRRFVYVNSPYATMQLLPFGFLGVINWIFSLRKTRKNKATKDLLDNTVAIQFYTVVSISNITRKILRFLISSSFTLQYICLPRCFNYISTYRCATYKYFHANILPRFCTSTPRR